MCKVGNVTASDVLIYGGFAFRIGSLLGASDPRSSQKSAPC